MIRLTDFLVFKEPTRDKQYNCLRCCLSDVGCDQLFDEARQTEPCNSIYIQVNKCTIEEALKHSGYLIFRY